MSKAKGRLVRQREVEQSAGRPSMELRQLGHAGRLSDQGGGGRRCAHRDIGRRSATDPSSETIVGGLSPAASAERLPRPPTPRQWTGEDPAAAVTDAEFVLQESPQRVSVRVSRDTLICCGRKTVWTYRTHGLRKLGQTDLLLVLEYIALDSAAPTDVVQLFGGILKKTREGSTVGNLDHTVFQASTSFLGSSFIGGVLYFMECGQCFHGLVNSADFGSLLVCRLVHTRELPYLVNSPVRLLLRLGLEDTVYPCGLVSNRYRPPVFYDPARSVLSMFREVLPLHDGMVPRLRDCNITLQSGSSCIVVSVSNRRHSELLELLQVYAQDTDGVLALGSELCQFADAHLVAREFPGGDFETLVFAAARTVTGGQTAAPAAAGLSFIALASHLNTADPQGNLAAIVEDGVGVECCRDDMLSLLQCLHKAEDFSLPIDWLFLHDKQGPLRNAVIRFVWRHLPGE